MTEEEREAVNAFKASIGSLTELFFEALAKVTTLERMNATQRKINQNLHDRLKALEAKS